MNLVVHAGESIQVAIDAAGSGATISVEPGLYREKLEITKSIILRGSGKGKSIISGSDPKANWVPEGAYWTIPYEPALGPRVIDGFLVCAKSPVCNDPTQVFIDGRQLEQQPTLAETNSGSFYVGNGKIYIADPPIGRAVEVSTRNYWLRGRADNVTISGFTFQHAANLAQAGGAFGVNGRADWRVLDNEFTDAAAADLDMSGRRVTVSGNDIHDGGQLGVAGKNYESSFERNRVHHNNTAGFSPNWEAGGSKWHQGGANPDDPPYQGVRICSNEIYDNEGPGIWVDVFGNGYSIAGNNVHDNALPGILFEISRNASITSNDAFRNGLNHFPEPHEGTSAPDWTLGAAILVLSSDNVTVSDNVLAWNADGITAWQDDRMDARMQNVVLERNFIAQHDPGDGSAFAIAWIGNPSHLADPALANRAAENRVHRHDTVRFSWSDSGAGFHTTDLAAFAATPGGQGTRELDDEDTARILEVGGLPPDP